MSTRDQSRLLAEENLRWIQNELARRKQAKLAAARQSRPIPGLSPIRLPSLAEGLDEIQPPPTRFAGRASE